MKKKKAAFLEVGNILRKRPVTAGFVPQARPLNLNYFGS
jgi:hypothetical protein